MNQVVLNQDSYTQAQDLVWCNSMLCRISLCQIRIDGYETCISMFWNHQLEPNTRSLLYEKLELHLLCPKQWNCVELLHKNHLSWNQTMQQLMYLPGSRKWWCSAAAAASLKRQLKLLPHQAPCHGKPEIFAVMLRAQQFLKTLEMPGNKQERITTTIRSKSFLQQMCAAVP
jgi:hypothetical protein